MKSSSTMYYVYMNTELIKILHVLFYIVSETEKLTITNCVDKTQYVSDDSTL